MLMLGFILASSLFGFDYARAKTPVLSAEEQSWMQQHNNTAIVAPENNYPPFIFTGSDGKPAGLSYDYLALIAEQVGLKLEFMSPAPLSEIMESLKQGRANIVTSVTRTPQREEFLSFTDSYVDVQAVIITNQLRYPKRSISELIADKNRVGVGKSYGVESYLETSFPSLGLVEFSDDQESLNNVIFGQVEAAIMDIGTASYMVSQNNLSNLVVAGTTDFAYHLAFASPKSDEALTSILNKGLQKLTSKQKEAIRSNWITLGSNNLPFYKSKGFRTFLIILGSGLILISGAVVIWTNTLRYKVNQKTKELRDEHARLIASINSLRRGLLVVSGDNEILLSNSAISKILLLPKKYSLHDVYNSFGKFDIQAIVDDAVAKKRRQIVDDIKVTDSIYRITCTPVIDDLNNSNGFVIVLDDITEEVVTNRSREEFFSLASHELKTPLTAIRGNSIMLTSMMDKKSDKEQLEMISDIASSSERLIAIVNDLIEATKVEFGSLEVSSKLFDLSEFISGITTGDYAKAVKDKGLNLEVDLQSMKGLEANTDAIILEKVFKSLLSNSLEYTKTGQIELSAKSHENHIEIRVKDTGIGIDEKMQPLLFRKFVRAESSLLTRESSQNIGMGLYLAKQYMKSLGGDLVLEESQPSKGSTFLVSIPAGDKVSP
jgi:two-component system, sensor histidine kinase and response regulator